MNIKRFYHRIVNLCLVFSLLWFTGAVEAVQAKPGEQAVAPVSIQAAGISLPRLETLYFSGQQWGPVACWNPYSSNCNNSMAIAQQDNARVTMFETPYMYNLLDGEQYPLLADGDYTWNAERTQITFNLKSATHWSDGTAVTATDVAYTWTAHVNHETPVWGSYQDYIDTIEAVNPYTVRVRAKLDGEGKAVNPLMVSAYLSSNYVIQKAWTLTLEARTSGNPEAFLNDPANDVIGSGPYKKHFVDDTEVVFIRDDNYWGQDVSMWGKLPAPKYLAHVIYPDNDAGYAAFEAGEVDISQMFFPNVQNYWLIDNLPVSTYYSDVPYGVTSSMPSAYYNLNSPGLDNVVIRKAIAMAVDYDAIIADAMTNQSPSFTEVPRSLMNPTPGEQALYDHDAVASLQWAGNDIAGAEALLDAAGIVDTAGDTDGWREYNGQNLHYVATCPNGWLDWQAAIELVAAAGQAIGIDITTNYPEWSEYQNAVTNWPIAEGYDIFMMWTEGSGPTHPWGRIRHLLSSDYAQTTGNWNGNWGGYINPAVDDLINAIPAETDPVVLKQHYTDLTEIYLTDVPSFALMYRPQSFHTVNESFWTGFPHDGDGTTPPVPPVDLTDGYSIAGLYNLDSLPVVTSIERLDPSPSSAAEVHFEVTFSEDVTGVNESDFSVAAPDLIDPASVTAVSGSGSTYTVTVATGSGNGTLRLDVIDDDSIEDTALHSLAGSRDGGFSAGETYTMVVHLTKPVLLLPQRNHITSVTTPTFDWMDVVNANRYDIEFATNSSFTVDVSSYSVSTSTFPATDPFGDGTYYWHVQAYDVRDSPGGWSTARTFTIDTTGPVTPTLQAPTDAVTLRSIPIFRWSTVSDAVLYQFQLDNDSDFSSPLVSVQQRVTYRKPAGGLRGTYSWRVRARDAAGNWGSWSDPFTITIVRYR